MARTADAAQGGCRGGFSDDAATLDSRQCTQVLRASLERSRADRQAWEGGARERAGGHTGAAAGAAGSAGKTATRSRVNGADGCGALGGARTPGLKPQNGQCLPSPACCAGVGAGDGALPLASMATRCVPVAEQISTHTSAP